MVTNNKILLAKNLKTFWPLQFLLGDLVLFPNHALNICVDFFLNEIQEKLFFMVYCIWELFHKLQNTVYEKEYKEAETSKEKLFLLWKRRVNKLSQDFLVGQDDSLNGLLMGEEHIGNGHLYHFWLGTFRFSVSAIESIERSAEGNRGFMFFKFPDLLLVALVHRP